MERFAYLSVNVPIELLERENLWLLKSLSNTKGPAFTNYEDDLREERRREKEFELESKNIAILFLKSATSQKMELDILHFKL